MHTWELGGPTGLLCDGRPVGHGPYADGYRRVRYESRSQLVHRVVYQIAYGPIPPGLQVDHIDRNRDNNAPSNLRLATMSEQRQNAGLLTNNKTGIRGLCWDKQTQSWRGSIQINGCRRECKNKDQAVVIEWLDRIRKQLHPRRPLCTPI